MSPPQPSGGGGGSWQDIGRGRANGMAGYAIGETRAAAGLARRWALGLA